MGPPNSGKSYQLIRVYQAAIEAGKHVTIIDLEDKMEATMLGLGIQIPKDFHICISWEEYKEAVNNIVDGTKTEKPIPPDSWILVDRIDLSWSMVQRWYTQQKYNQELSEKMLEKAKAIIKSSFMVAPRVDQGSWQVINEAYESTMLKLLYKSRCNIVMTTGIRGIDDNNPLDMFGHLGVAPRGQKELPHQPHSVFLLHQKKIDKMLSWLITTAKDLPGREWYDSNVLVDIWLQYIMEYEKNH